jgi:hypothetical protein
MKRGKRVPVGRMVSQDAHRVTADPAALPLATCARYSAAWSLY